MLKSFGLPALAVFLLLFSLVSDGKNWFPLLESSRGSSLPVKDVVYRFERRQAGDKRTIWAIFFYADEVRTWTSQPLFNN
ncbi:hypothetical protein ACFOLF_05045 [Paenibacillus sepulcri]|uniref:Uncharacterized protein n=1 Tax=Paenibacillus sepulcri TaxID=359917 RepID=A0ABS7BXU4_9BACL|nr:hypothetical protein [Paenibacillus sepulcri]